MFGNAYLHLSQPHSATQRPVSLMERMSALESSAQKWKVRVPAGDAAQFTVAGRLAASASNVPAVLASSQASTTASSASNVPSLLVSSEDAEEAASSTSPRTHQKKRSPQPKVIGRVNSGQGLGVHRTLILAMI